jgi:hypothetical protein
MGMKSVAILAALLASATVLSGCYQAPPSDSDQDGLTDAQELAGWDVTVTQLDGTTTARHVTSDPHKAATDGTLLDDHYKYALGLDPRSADSDGDGLLDCQEVLEKSRGHCLDSAFKGTTDGGYKTLANRADTDRDGLSDGQEANGFNVTWADGTVRLTRTDPLKQDSDGDGLRDGDEPDLGGDPLNPDTDGDGCRDGLDVYPGVDARFKPGLLNFTWKGSQPAQIRFLLGVGGLAEQWPDTQSPALQLQPGQTIDLSQMPQPSFAATCTFQPTRPWLNLDVIPYRMDAPGGQAPVDVTSVSASGDAGHTSYYNPRSGTVSNDVSGTFPHPLPLLLEGAGGRLGLHPFPVDAEGRILKGHNQNP